MIDEKKIEEAAEKFAEKCSGDYIATSNAIDAFKAGIDWFLDNLWHDASEEPEQDKVTLIQLKDDGSWHTAIFVGIEFRIIDMNQDDEYLLFTDDVTRWLYVDDLLKGGK